MSVEAAYFGDPWRLKLRARSLSEIKEAVVELLRTRGFIPSGSDADVFTSSPGLWRVLNAVPDRVVFKARGQSDNWVDLEFSFGVSRSFVSAVSFCRLLIGATALLLFALFRTPGAGVSLPLFLAGAAAGCAYTFFFPSQSVRFMHFPVALFQDLGKRTREMLGQPLGDLAKSPLPELVVPQKWDPCAVPFNILSLGDAAFYIGACIVGRFPWQITAAFVAILVLCSLFAWGAKHVSGLDVVGLTIVFGVALVVLFHLPLLLSIAAQVALASEPSLQQTAIVKNLSIPSLTTKRYVTPEALSSVHMTVRLGFVVVAAVLALALRVTLSLRAFAIPWRNLNIQRATRVNRILRGVGILFWVLIGAGLLHAVLMNTAAVFNSLPHQGTIDLTSARITQLDTHYYSALFLSTMLEPEKAIGLAKWATAIYLSLLPMFYCYMITARVYERARNYKTCSQCRLIDRPDIEDELHKVVEAAQPAKLNEPIRPILTLEKKDILFSLSTYFPTRNAYFIVIWPQALNRTREDIRGLLGHEYHHLQRHAKLLWALDWLSYLTFCGNGFLFAIIDVHQMEFDADDAAISAMGGAQFARTYCMLLDDIYDSLSEEDAVRINPAAAVLGLNSVGENLWKSSSNREAAASLYDIVFLDPNAPYVHPSREERKQRIQQKYRVEC